MRMTLDALFPDGFSHDTLLGGRVKIAQPKGGYRVAVDPVLLAAAVPAAPGERLADLGTGTGAVALCLAARTADCRIAALELEADLVELTRSNVQENGFGARVTVSRGDVAAPPFAPGSFGHVAMNPPYLSAGKATAPAGRLRRVAALEGSAKLRDWLLAGWRLTKPGGTVTLIHRADRLDEIIAGLRSLQPGGCTVIPLWPKASEPAHRVLVRCRKGDASPFALRPGLVLHEASGAFTPAAEKILRDGWALDEALATL